MLDDVGDSQLTMSGSPDPSVRRQVALNTDTPPDVLADLFRDSVVDVRVAAAGHPRLPAGLIEVAASDRDLLVRTAAAGNPAQSVSILRRLAIDPEPSVRFAAAPEGSVHARTVELGLP